MRQQTVAGGGLTSCPLCETPDVAPHFQEVSVWKCRQCALIFRNPRPGEDELARVYRDSYRPDLIATGETEMAGTTLALAQRYLRSISRTIELRGRRVLDFGAGLGTMSIALREHGAHAVAIEPFAWRECERVGLEVYRCLSDLPATARFDGVVALQVIEHLPFPWTTLKEIASLLKPKGWLYVATPNAAGLNARICGARWRELLKPTHLMFFTERTLEQALEKAGFQRYTRLKGLMRYADSPAKRVLHAGLQLLALDGELRYLAEKS